MYALASWTNRASSKTLMFPTLGVTMEGFFSDDVDMLYDCFHAFNRWVEATGVLPTGIASSPPLSIDARPQSCHGRTRIGVEAGRAADHHSTGSGLRALTG